MRRFIVGIILFFILAGVLWYFFGHLLTTPFYISPEERQKKINALLEYVPQSSPIPRDPSWKIFTGNTVTFEYPSETTFIPNMPINSVIVENVSYSLINQHTRATIQALSIADLTSLEDYAQVKIRRQDQYDASKANLLGNEGLLFVRKSGTVELAYFFLIHNMAYSFVFNGVNEDELRQFAQKTLDSVSFL